MSQSSLPQKYMVYKYNHLSRFPTGGADDPISCHDTFEEACAAAYAASAAGVLLIQVRDTRHDKVLYTAYRNDNTEEHDSPSP